MYVSHLHFHTAQTDGLYNLSINALSRQDVVVYDAEGRICAADRVQSR
jgi:hypothetical protein